MKGVHSPLPIPDESLYPPFLVEAQNSFGQMVDFRSFPIPEDEELCQCSLLETCAMCKQPCINEEGCLEIDLWRINGKQLLVNSVFDLVRKASCEIVRVDGFKRCDVTASYIEMDMLQWLLDYYSGPEFHKTMLVGRKGITTRWD